MQFIISQCRLFTSQFWIYILQFWHDICFSEFLVYISQLRLFSIRIAIFYILWFIHMYRLNHISQNILIHNFKKKSHIFILKSLCSEFKSCNSDFFSQNCTFVSHNSDLILKKSKLWDIISELWEKILKCELKSAITILSFYPVAKHESYDIIRYISGKMVNSAI